MNQNSFFYALMFLSMVCLAACEKKSDDVNQKPAFKHKTEVVTPSPSPSKLDPFQVEPKPLPTEIPIPPAPLEEIPKEYTFAEKLAQAALERTTHDVTYDGRYQKIAYPMGDVP